MQKSQETVVIFYRICRGEENNTSHRRKINLNMLGEKEEGKRESEEICFWLSVETDTINRGVSRCPSLCLLRRHRLR